MAAKGAALENFDVLLDGALLSEISNYQVERTDGRLYIVVHQVLSSPLRGKFVAAPTITHRDGKEEFIGQGDTRDEALRECLRKIKDVSFGKIFASRKAQK